ncbi:uncharacterized protein LOC134440265 [Engraulis encrasicolus]|uniref:uncharacterized protein LOC134440265 n=1 Tax=Engraulis encrasicolus TaxID=184585 RepID=UPI002FD79572
MVTTSEALHMTTEPVYTTEPDLTTVPMTTERLPTTTITTTTALVPSTIPEMTTELPPPSITERITERPLPSTAMTTYTFLIKVTKGQGSPVPDNVLVSTSVPTILENSSELWRMVVYGILALLGLVILCAVVLFIIRRIKRDRNAAYSPSHMSMEALWDSPLLSNPLGYSLNPLESTSFEPKSSAANTSGPNTSETKTSEPNTSETNTSEHNSSEPKQSDI